MGLTSSLHVYTGEFLLCNNTAPLAQVWLLTEWTSALFYLIIVYAVGKLLRCQKISTVHPMTIKKLQAKLIWQETNVNWVSLSLPIKADYFAETPPQEPAVSDLQIRLSYYIHIHKQSEQVAYRETRCSNWKVGACQTMSVCPATWSSFKLWYEFG